MPPISCRHFDLRAVARASVIFAALWRDYFRRFRLRLRSVRFMSRACARESVRAAC